MYGFGEELTKENLLLKVSSYDIFKYYSDNFTEVGKHFNSDFRQEDNPSCCIAQIKGDLLYTDFGTGESYRCIDFVMAKYQLGFVDALNQINSDFNLGLGNKVQRSLAKNVKPAVSKTKLKFEEKTHTVIKKKQRSFTPQDLKYWKEFYWTEEMLTLSKTQSISHYWINGYMFKVKPDELAFSYEYYWHGGRAQRKLYFPLRDEYKWFSNVDNSIVQLVDVAPKQGDILIITSSKKDAGIFWRMNLERALGDIIIHGVSPNNEGSFVPEKWLKKAQKRYKDIIIWYNNDWHKENNPGVTNAKKFSEKYMLPYYYNPDNTPKDPSDFAKKYGLQEFVNYFKQQLKK